TRHLENPRPRARARRRHARGLPGVRRHARHPAARADGGGARPAGAAAVRRLRGARRRARVQPGEAAGAPDRPRAGDCSVAIPHSRSPDGAQRNPGTASAFAALNAGYRIFAVNTSFYVPHDIEAPIAGSASGPIAGLTAAVKDLYDVAGTRTGGGNPEWLA